MSSNVGNSSIRNGKVIRSSTNSKTSVSANNHSLGVTSRIIAAAVVGYLLSMVACLCLAYWLALPEREVRLFGNMLLFLVYANVAMWVFTLQSHVKAVAGVCLCTLLLWLLWWFVGGVTQA